MEAINGDNSVCPRFCRFLHLLSEPAVEGVATVDAVVWEAELPAG